MKIDGSVLEKKSYFEILGLSSHQIWKLDRGPYIACIAKTASKKLGALICSIKFIFFEVTFYIYKYTMQLCMEYCWHIWAGVSTWYLVMLEVTETGMQDCWTNTCCLSWTQSHRKNLFLRYYFGRCSSELNSIFSWVVHSLFWWVIFLPSFLVVIRMPMSTVSFHAQLDPGILCLQDAFLWPLIWIDIGSF